jgi:uncharacterized protein
MSPPPPPSTGGTSEPPAWSGNPYSALALHPPEEPQLERGPPARPALLPWWLSPLAVLAVAFILFYRNVIPHGWKRRCIYTPTCSMYGLTSIKKYGFTRGALRTWNRIHRCNAVLFQGGHDEP